MRKLLVLCLMLLPVAASAQQGTILFDLAVQFDYDLLPAGREALRDQIPPLSFTSPSMLQTVANLMSGLSFRAFSTKSR